MGEGSVFYHQRIIKMHTCLKNRYVNRCGKRPEVNLVSGLKPKFVGSRVSLGTELVCVRGKKASLSGSESVERNLEDPELITSFIRQQLCVTYS